MPTTPLALVLLVAVLLPGFAFLARRERRHPAAIVTPLREIANILVVSATANVAVGGGVWLARAVWPASTPDIGALFRDGGSYIARDYQVLTLWSVGSLAAACALAAIVADPPRWVAEAGGRLFGVRKSKPPLIEQLSAWSRAFHAHPDRVVYLQCQLKDGTEIAGPLYSFSPQIEETGDRELVVAGPVTASTAAESLQLDVGAVIVSAREISYLAVSYLPSDTPEEGRASE